MELYFLNFELETLLSAEDLCLSHAPGGKCFHVSVDFMQGEVGKRSVSKRASKTACNSLACSCPLWCFCSSDSIGLAVWWLSLFFIFWPVPVLSAARSHVRGRSTPSLLLPALKDAWFPVCSREMYCPAYLGSTGGYFSDILRVGYCSLCLCLLGC